LAHTSDLGPFIAVAPDGHGPAVEVGDWADTGLQHLGAAVSDDLRTWMESTLRTDGRWGVMGLSSGGYGAAYLGMRSPAMYQAVCAMSGFFEARSPAFAHESANARSQASPLFHASASRPRTLLFVGSGDTESLGYAKRYLQALQTAGQPGDLRIIPGSHDWPVWKTATPDCLRFLLTPPARPNPPAPSS
jgi:S-formylglutathione hydrolase FrmB